MKDQESKFLDTIRRLEEAGWSEVVDRLILGVCHGLNGRISSLGALAYLVQSGEEGNPLLVTTLEEETDQIGGLIRLLEVIPDDGFLEAEAISVEEIVGSLGGLMRRQKGLEEVEIRSEAVGEPPPVLMNRTVLLRCLLLLLTQVAVEAREVGVDRVEAHLSEREEGAEITFRPGSTAPETPRGPSAYAPSPTIKMRKGLAEGLGRILAEEGGRLEADDLGPEGTRMRVWLPSLAKRRESS